MLGIIQFKNLFFVATVELVLGVFITLCDTAIAGYIADETGVSAMNVLTPVITVIIFAATMIAFGSSVCYGNAMGKADKDRADKIFGTGLIVLIVFGIAAFITVSFGFNIYVDYLDINAKIIYYASEYLYYYKFVILIDAVCTFIGIMIANDGGESIANISNILAIGGNLILSIFLASSFGLNMGITEVSLGTLLSKFLRLAILSFHFFSKRNSLHAKAFFSFNYLWDFIKKGFADSQMFLSASILHMILNKFVIYRFGDFYLPVLYIAVAFIEMTIIFDGVAEAFMPFASVYYSENNYPAFYKLSKFAFTISIIEGVVSSFLVFYFAEYIPLFFNIKEPELIACTITVVRIMSTTLILSSVLYFFETYYVIQNKLLVSFLSSTLRNFVLILAISIPLSLIFGFTNMWWGVALSPLATLIICAFIIYIRYGKKDFPFYIDDKGLIADFNLILSPSTIMNTQREIEIFLKKNSIPSEKILRIMLIVEETGILIYEKNRNKKIIAEMTVIINKDKNLVRLIIRDNGEIFNITDADNEIKSLNSYVVSRLMNRLRIRKNITTTSLNRNIFDF